MKPLRRRRIGREAFAYLPDGEAIERTPMHWAARSTLYALTLLLASVVAWAAWAEVDRIVAAPGRLVTTAPMVVVQPLETGVVRAIAVRPGDTVAAGDRLATLDPTFAAADLADLKARLAGVDAHIDRLRAEIGNHPFAEPADPGLSPDEALQAVILERRRAEHRARLAAFDERAARLEAALATSRNAQRGLAERLAVVEEMEAIRRELHENRTGSRLLLLEARDGRLNLRNEIDSLRDRERETGHELSGVAAERAAYIDEWRRRAAEDLVEQIRQQASLREQIAKAERRASLVVLTAPVDAVVLEVARLSVGSVAREAEPLVTLVPVDVPLEVEADIPAADIALVRNGDPVRVKLDAFPFQRHGTLPGVVRTISADAFRGDGGGRMEGSRRDGADPAAGAPAVFRARVTLAAARLDGAPEGAPLLPGMQATAEIRIGVRSVLSYFLYPVVRAFDESIREP